MKIFKKRWLRKYMLAQQKRIIRDKPFIDYIRKKENWLKSSLEISQDLKISVDAVNRICFNYRDAIENDVHYKTDILNIFY